MLPEESMRKLAHKPFFPDLLVEFHRMNAIFLTNLQVQILLHTPVQQSSTMVTYHEELTEPQKTVYNAYPRITASSGTRI